MKTIPKRLMFACVIVLTLAAGQSKAPDWKADLRMSIEAILARSIGECASFYAGDRNCVESQFLENFPFYLLRTDCSGIAGHPGIPGPPGPGDDPHKMPSYRDSFCKS